MVRVGGGWVALDEFLVKNDPCRGMSNCLEKKSFSLIPKKIYKEDFFLQENLFKRCQKKHFNLTKFKYG